METFLAIFAIVVFGALIVWELSIKIRLVKLAFKFLIHFLRR
jgi:hypothetical protein